jgi:toxin YoeB
LNVSFTPIGWEGYQYWIEHDPKMLGKIGSLIREHRLVYRVTGSGDDQRVEIAQCRFHH